MKVERILTPFDGGDYWAIQGGRLPKKTIDRKDRLMSNSRDFADWALNDPTFIKIVTAAKNKFAPEEDTPEGKEEEK